MNTRFLQASFACSVMALLLASSALAQPTEDFDIFVFDVKKGTTQQVTSIPGAGEFNPSFSNNGKQIVHDVVVLSPSFSHDLYVTDVKTGTSTPLSGGNGGDDGVWSPNGNLIAFGRLPVRDRNLYVVPAGGGTRTLVRTNANDPDWSPNSKRLVFTDGTDGSVRTVDINTGAETTVASFGLNPVWSRNGKAIAFTDGNSLLVVPVNNAGAATGSPVQLTFDGLSVTNSQPSWSNNSKTIVFTSNRGGADFNVWTVPAAGGTPTLLTGLAGAGDYDPAYSKNGQFVAYTGAGAPAPATVAAFSSDFDSLIPGPPFSPIGDGWTFFHTQPGPGYFGDAPNGPQISSLADDGAGNQYLNVYSDYDNPFRSTNPTFEFVNNVFQQQTFTATDALLEETWTFSFDFANADDPFGVGGATTTGAFIRVFDGSFNLLAEEVFDTTAAGPAFAPGSVSLTFDQGWITGGFVQFGFTSTTVLFEPSGVYYDNVDFFPAVSPPFMLGDANGDGVLDFIDVNAFLQALFDPAAYATAYPGVDPDVVLDMNNDGELDFLDVTPFITALGF